MFQTTKVHFISLMLFVGLVLLIFWTIVAVKQDFRIHRSQIERESFSSAVHRTHPD
jgi:hypothetical protein